MLWAGAGALLCFAQGERDPAAPFEGGPQSAWNRLHGALFLRTDAQGGAHGAGELDPLLFSNSRWLLAEPRATQLEAALAGLLDDARQIEEASPLARALMQRDLWAVHDWLAQAKDAVAEARAERLRRLVAGAMAELALDPAHMSALVATLRDNQAQLPGDLARILDSGAEPGPWLRLGALDDMGTLTSHHLAHFGARSAFSVHLNVPGGPEVALRYLELLRGSELTVGEGDELRLAPQLPQPPPGTSVALVRRSLHLDRGGYLHVLPLIENVQLRTFPRTAPPADFGVALSVVDGARFESSYWRAYQAVRELELDRAGLLAGRSPLREVGPAELSYSSFDNHGDPLEGPPRGHRRARLEGCTGCHGAPGFHSVVSFTGVSSGPGTQLDVTLRQPPRRLGLEASEQPDAPILAAAQARPELALLLGAWLARAPREDVGGGR